MTRSWPFVTIGLFDCSYLDAISVDGKVFSSALDIAWPLTSGDENGRTLKSNAFHSAGRRLLPHRWAAAQS